MSMAGEEFTIQSPSTDAANETEDKRVVSDEVIDRTYRESCAKAEKQADANLLDADEPDEYLDMWVGMYENSINSLEILEGKGNGPAEVQESIRELAYARTYARYINEMNGMKAHNEGHELLREIFSDVGQMKAAVQPLTLETLPNKISENLTADQKVALLELDNTINDVVTITETGRAPKSTV